MKVHLYIIPKLRIVGSIPPSAICFKGVVLNYVHKHVYLLHEHCVTCSLHSATDEATPSYGI